MNGEGQYSTEIMANGPSFYLPDETLLFDTFEVFHLSAQCNYL